MNSERFGETLDAIDGAKLDLKKAKIEKIDVGPGMMMRAVDIYFVQDGKRFMFHFTAMDTGNGKPTLVVPALEAPRVTRKAQEYLSEEPRTVTADRCDRSAGGVHDFYSEGDYWWPDPDNPDGPYIRRDGMTNPDNFVAHRRAMVRLSEIVGTLASAWVITGDERYAAHANRHLQAWFVDEDTRMNPCLATS